MKRFWRISLQSQPAHIARDHYQPSRSQQRFCSKQLEYARLHSHTHPPFRKAIGAKCISILLAFGILVNLRKEKNMKRKREEVLLAGNTISENALRGVWQGVSAQTLRAL